MLIFWLFFSPLLAVAVAVAVVFIARFQNLAKPENSVLFRLSTKYAFIGAGAALLLTVVWGFWYEATTGFSAGNAPLAWIFIYGPVSAALGQLVALARWWRMHEGANVAHKLFQR